jgi:hypothetical protein
MVLARRTTRWGATLALSLMLLPPIAIAGAAPDCGRTPEAQGGGHSGSNPPTADAPRNTLRFSALPAT